MQNPNGTCYKNGKKNFIIHIDPQKTSNSQINIEKEQSWRASTSWFQNVLHNYSNQNSIVPAQRPV